MQWINAFYIESYRSKHYLIVYITVKQNDERDLFLSEMELVWQQMVYSHKRACSQFGFSSNTELRQDLKGFTHRKIDKLGNVLPARF